MKNQKSAKAFTPEEIDGYASRFVEKYGDDALSETLYLSMLFHNLGDKRAHQVYVKIAEVIAKKLGQK